ncbi:42647_t:CDS:1, partial [Gigaspora margarita]
MPKKHITKSYAFVKKQAQALERFDHEAFVEELHIENITAEMELEYEREHHEEVIKELEQQGMEWVQNFEVVNKERKERREKRK